MAYLSQLYIKLAGANVSEQTMDNIISVEVDDNLLLPDMFSIHLRDPGFITTDSGNFDLGKKVEISVKGQNGSVKLMSGDITALEPQFSRETGPTILIRGFDESHRLHRSKQTKSYVQMTDSDIAQSIARDCGLSANTEGTSQVHDYVFQDNQTAMEFLQDRAHRIGFHMYVEDKTLYFKSQPGMSARTPVLEWGKDLLDFEARLTAANQVKEVIVRGWDLKTKKEIVGQARTPGDTPETGESRKGGDAVQSAFGMNSREVVIDRPVANQSEAEKMAQSICDKMGNSFLQASGTCFGNPEVQAGSMVELKGIGQKFSGKYRITHALHIYNNEGYTTEFTISGHQSNTLSELLQPKEETRRGVVIGLVTNNQDPDGLCRVKVKYPTQPGNEESFWARLSTPMAGTNMGVEFVPEVNDEVLVAFEHDDVHRPFVIGSLWNGKDSPPEKSSSIIKSRKDQKRNIRTRTGHILTFDDSDEECRISLIDKTGNNLILIDSKNNVLSLKSAGDMIFEAKGKIKIKGSDLEVEAQNKVNFKAVDVELEAQSQGKLKATNIEVAAQASTKITGNASASLEASGQVTIKGGMVNIN
jgi:phage protein D/phage baseplate assembly protein gpV